MADELRNNSTSTRRWKSQQFSFDRMSLQQLDVPQITVADPQFATLDVSGKLDSANPIVPDTFQGYATKTLGVLGEVATGTDGVLMQWRFGQGNGDRGLGLADDGEDPFDSDPTASNRDGLYLKGTEVRIRTADKIIVQGNEVQARPDGTATLYGGAKTIIGLPGQDLILRGNILLSVNSTGVIITDAAHQVLDLGSATSGSWVLAQDVPPNSVLNVVTRADKFLQAQGGKVITLKNNLQVWARDQIAGISPQLAVAADPVINFGSNYAESIVTFVTNPSIETAGAFSNFRNLAAQGPYGYVASIGSGLF